MKRRDGVSKKRRCLQSFMNRPTESSVPIEIRRPRIDDIPAIVEVVHGCGPQLTAHSSYIPWIYTHFYFETCAVAEMDGGIVGWCSIIPVPGSFFLHQLGVKARARREGIARALLTHQVQKLSSDMEKFSLHFTVDRRNRAVVDLSLSIAEQLGMQVIKRSGVLPLVEDAEEELYIMTPQQIGISAKPMAFDEFEAMSGTA